MDDVVIASNEADLQAAEAVREHHQQLSGALALRAERVLEAARTGTQSQLSGASRDLADWCRTELVPHARAEEETLYPAAAALPEGRLLVEAMVAEHRVIVGLLDELDSATHPVTAAGTAQALRVVFESHLVKENEQILPLLVSASGVSLAGLLGGMHELLGGHEHAAEEGHHAAGHSCDCHEDEPPLPELDARAIPHAIRHATVFGALDAVRAGQAMVLVAPHDPLPLLAQLERRDPGVFTVEYLEQGPEAWRLKLLRSAG